MKENEPMGSAFTSNANINDGGKDKSSGRGADSVIRWIGDLDHPFYNDERSRFVWYEASAVAFQMLFLGIYFFTGLMLWIGGAAALPYSLPFLFLAVASGLLIKSVVARNSAEYFPNKLDLTKSRGKVTVVVFLFLLSGIIRALNDLGSDSDGGFWGGYVNFASVGVVVGAIAGVAGIAHDGRKHRKQEAAAELRED